MDYRSKLKEAQENRAEAIERGDTPTVLFYNGYCRFLAAKATGQEGR